MDKDQLKKINYALIDTFLIAGDRSIELRKAGLKKEIKSDNTPVTNGDIEVNNILTEKIKNITSDIPIVSEESSNYKSNNNLLEIYEYEEWIDNLNKYKNSPSYFMYIFTKKNTKHEDIKSVSGHMRLTLGSMIRRVQLREY